MSDNAQNAWKQSVIKKQQASQPAAGHTDYSLEGNAVDSMQHGITQPIRIAFGSSLVRNIMHKRQDPQYPTNRNVENTSSEHTPTPAFPYSSPPLHPSVPSHVIPSVRPTGTANNRQQLPLYGKTVHLARTAQSSRIHAPSHGSIAAVDGHAPDRVSKAPYAERSSFQPVSSPQRSVSQQGQLLFRGKLKQRQTAVQRLQRFRLQSQGPSVDVSIQVEPQALDSIRTTAWTGSNLPDAPTIYPSTGKHIFSDRSGTLQAAHARSFHQSKYKVQAAVSFPEQKSPNKTAASKKVSAKATQDHSDNKKSAGTKRAANLNKTADKAWLKRQTSERGKTKAQNEAARKAKRAARGTSTTASGAKGVIDTVRKLLHLPGKAALSTLLLPLLVITLIFVIIIAGSTFFVLGTAFGIFASGDGGLKDVIAEIEQEYQEKLQDIQDSYEYDELDITGAQADWRTVLSLYAVLTANDPDNPQEVITINDVKEDLLRNIFWRMHNITWELETEDIPNPDAGETIPPKDDGYYNEVIFGDPSETTPPETAPPTIEFSTLHITVDTADIDLLSLQLGFTEEQRTVLTELLLPENLSLWNNVVYGITLSSLGDIQWVKSTRPGCSAVVSMGLSQVGQVGGQPYWSYCGFGERVGWCGCFVTWVMNHAGVGRLYSRSNNNNNPATIVRWAKENDRWVDGSFTDLTEGDVIFFSWDVDGHADHVAIVIGRDSEHIYTVEGNMSDSVCSRKYKIGDPVILGYLLMDYSVIPELGSSKYVTNSGTIPYLLYTPANAADYDEIPLIVWLHGVGGTEWQGNCTTEAQFRQGSFMKVLDSWKLEDFCAYVVCPHLVGEYDAYAWNTKAAKSYVEELIHMLTKNYNIDTDRIIIAGHSLGGQGALYMAQQLPDYFSCCASLSPYNPDVDITTIDIPTIAYIGGEQEDDLSVDYANGWFADAFGNQNVFVVDTWHGNVPNMAFNQDNNDDGRSDLIDWMLSHTKG